MSYYVNLGQKEINAIFIRACSDCDLNLIRHLLTSKELKTKANIIAKNNEGLRLACLNGKADNQLEVVRYLLTSPELRKHADSTHEGAFRDACSFGKSDVVKFLLRSPELNKHANIHADQNYAFFAACKYERFDLLDFYVNEMKIEVTKYMVKQVESNIIRGCDGQYEEYSYQAAMKFKQIIDFATKIDSDLSEKPVQKRKPKI